MAEAFPNYNNVAFGGGYDPANRYAGAENGANERETEIVKVQVQQGGNTFGTLTLGPHTTKMVQGILGDLAFGAWDDFENWLAANEAIFTGEAGAEMRSIFIHGFNTGNAMRKDDEERNGKITFTLVS